MIFKLLKANRIPEKKKTKPKVMGKKIFQPMYINWSNRKRGKFARTKINKKVMQITLIAKINSRYNFGINKVLMLKILNSWWLVQKISKKKIFSEAPIKNTTNKEDIKSILLYSPKKKAAKVIPEYSTLYPATNSASASGKSKGALFVSANIETKKIKAKGKRGYKKIIVSTWVWITSFKLKDPDKRMIGIKIRLIDIS